MRQGKSWLERLSDGADLPEMALPGVPLGELAGDRRVLIENHGGIISYGEALIEISCGKTRLIVRGDNLMLKAMTGSDMLICGRIISLEFE